ncbi:MAG: hypothetical protein KAU38_02100, partial [Desulfobacterales bacterium]|nr:hypothetical protein [Desulfobacterales bacterium]
AISGTQKKEISMLSSYKPCLQATKPIAKSGLCVKAETAAYFHLHARHSPLRGESINGGTGSG